MVEGEEHAHAKEETGKGVPPGRRNETRMKRSRQVLFALAIGITMAGCHYLGEDRLIASYRESLRAWTRQAEDYGNFETRILARATFKSRPFREAFVAEYEAVYLLGEKERTALYQREIDEATRYHAFLLYVYTPDVQRNVLDRPTSPWRLYLEDEAGHRVAPETIRKKHDPGHTLEHFYPYVENWGRIYEVRFPKAPIEGRRLRLVITGISGRCAMEWEL
ncbi:MAG: hypothetical protein D6812_10785 [Deltaproteobacteria bacterium]|nr:MAG: hypothetical protein D6812_10785 [Deltaproteobacteria bacterium]